MNYISYSRGRIPVEIFAHRSPRAPLRAQATQERSPGSRDPMTFQTVWNLDVYIKDLSSCMQTTPLKFFRALCGPNQNISICFSLQPSFYKHFFLLFQSVTYLGVIWLLHLEAKNTAGEPVERRTSKPPCEVKVKVQSLWWKFQQQDLGVGLPVSIPQLAEESEKEPSKGKGLLNPLILDQGQCARERWEVWCSPVHHGDYHSYYPGIQSCGPASILQGTWDAERSKEPCHWRWAESCRVEQNAGAWAASSTFRGPRDGKWWGMAGGPQGDKFSRRAESPSADILNS